MFCILNFLVYYFQGFNAVSVVLISLSHLGMDYIRSGSNSKKPDYEHALQLLQHLSTTDLSELSSDDSRIQEMVLNLQQMKELASEKEMILTSNKSLAEFNLSQEPKLVEKRTQLLELHKQANELVTDVTEKKSSLETLENQTSVDTLLAILQAKTAESEEKTEELAEKFLDGSKDIDSFLEEYHEKRKLAHLRRIKAERMQELISSRNSNVSRRAPPIPAQVAAPMPPYPQPQWQPPNPPYYAPL
ncbi:Vacuolar protein sorting-associated protein 37B [Nymphon striatum]|nr:Vacuolar protein sorting-associated protein 37B [Nymphon striatum]